MKVRVPGRKLSVRILVAFSLVAAAVGGAAIVVQSQSDEAGKQGYSLQNSSVEAEADGEHAEGEHGHSHGTLLALRGQVGLPKVTIPAKLPIKSGAIATKPAAPAGTSSTTPAPEPAPEPSPAASPSPEAQPSTAPVALEATTATNKVALRSLVIATDANDFGLATWKANLDAIGTPYDVLLARDSALGALTRADGTGKYNAILLTNNSLLINDNGNYTSALDATEWTTLWDYERNYKVRQVSLYTSHGTYPEDYCLDLVSEGGINETAQPATLTAAGAPIFDYLKSNVQIPISLSYVYKTKVRAGCAATPIMNLGGNTVGVTSTSTDGRERAALTFTSNQYLPQASMLTYGMLRWATKGVFVGEQRHWLNADVDDWFNSTDQLLPNGTVNSDPGYRMTGTDVTSSKTQQNALRSTYPLANGFKINAAYNGEGIQSGLNVLCLIMTGDALSNQSLCNKNEFRWINHTYTHPKMNVLDYQTSLNEIKQNLTKAQQVGLTVPPTVLKTGEYSGLGVYHPDVNNDIDPPTDFGLAASNANMLKAAKDAGVKYLHGNMSFNSHKPSCFNCGIYHPLEPSLLVVPDWPTNIAYHTTNPAEQTQFYNSYYGPQGKFPFWPTNQTFDQIMGHESDVALQHVMTGSVYAHTFHQGNLRQYATNKNLVFDWLRAVVGKYSNFYNVPLRNPDWVALAEYVAARNTHFGAIGNGADAVWDRTTNNVTFTGPAASTLFVTGVKATGFDQYGTDAISKVTAGTSQVAFPKL